MTNKKNQQETITVFAFQEMYETDPGGSMSQTMWRTLSYVIGNPYDIKKHYGEHRYQSEEIFTKTELDGSTKEKTFIYLDLFHRLEPIEVLKITSEVAQQRCDILQAENQATRIQPE